MTTPSTPPPSEGLRQYRFTPAPGACRLLLVRHAESAPVHPDRPFPLVDGQSDAPLAPSGFTQAQLLAERLAATERISAIYVTSLQRTHQTAAPLASMVSLAPIVVPELREQFLGEWEGGELRRRARAKDPLYLRAMHLERWDIIPGAERCDDFNCRIRGAITQIAQNRTDCTVVVVVHSGVIGQLLARATGTSGFAFAHSDNASISELVIAETRHTLRRFNDTAHLEIPGCNGGGGQLSR
jgi:probable phosphoglycerate mutase